MNENETSVDSDNASSYFDIKLKPVEEKNENEKVNSTPEILGVLFLSILMIGIVCFAVWKVKISFKMLNFLVMMIFFCI